MKSQKLSFALSLVCVATAQAGNPIADWTNYAATAIVTNGGKAAGASGVWFAYSSIAAYDAVNAITGRHQPFYYRIQAPSNASIDAAAVAASHRVLVNYFPAQQTALDNQYTASIAGVIADPTSRDAGIAVGEAAAMELISMRTGDGLEANISYTPGSGPGAWIPTPPGFTAPVTPWLGQMRPFVMKSAGDFLPDPPPALTSETWKRDYNLTRYYGGVTSSTRSDAEAEIGIFWTDNTGAQFARMFSSLVANYNLGTEDAARMMAILWTGYSDAGIGCFNAKYHYGFWRPVTAIPVGGGNPDLTADPSWLALSSTPGHPEYPAAHGCITGAVTPLIADFFGTTKVHLPTDSKVFTDGVHQHTFEDTRDLMDEIFWARMYAGFHFHHSLEVGKQLGQSVADLVIRSHFRPRSEGR